MAGLFEITKFECTNNSIKIIPLLSVLESGYNDENVSSVYSMLQKLDIFLCYHIQKYSDNNCKV